MEVTYGVVIRSLDRGESDAVVELFTEKLGRVYAVAKGGKKSKRRFLNKLEPFSHLRVILGGRRKGVLRLDQADAVAYFPNLLLDVRRALCGFYALELVHALTPLWDPHPEVLGLLVRFLRFLDRSDPKEGHLRVLEMRMLEEMGYRPNLERCPGCGDPIDGPAIFFFPKGTAYHPGCAQGKGVPLSPETVRWLKGGFRGSLPAEGKVAEEAKGLLPAFIEYQSGRPLRTPRVMEEMGIWSSIG